MHEHGRDAADQQFPGSGREQIERCRLVAQGQVQAAHEAGDGEHHQDLAPMPGRGEGQQRWDKEVELFFNRERPHVQQGLGRRLEVEVTRLAQQYKVCGEGQRTDDLLLQRFNLHGWQEEFRRNDSCKDRYERSRQQAFGAAKIEFFEGELIAR
ncbi:hypothetical protein D3C76_771720 [compost metagenome]